MLIAFCKDYNKRLPTMFELCFGFIFAVTYIYAILAFIGFLNEPSHYIVSWISILVCLAVFYIYKKASSLVMFGLSFVLILYTIFSQFGLGIIYFLFGAEHISQYDWYVLRFFQSEQYSRAVLLSIVAIMSYAAAAYLGSLRGSKAKRTKQPRHLSALENESTLIVRLGLVFLAAAIVYYSIQLATGRINLSQNYMHFFDTMVTDNSIYPYIVAAYGTGIIYVLSAGKSSGIKLGLCLFAAVAVLMFTIGSRSGVLYAAMACVGVAHYRKIRIPIYFILLMLFVVFIVLPFISFARTEGVLNGSHYYNLSLMDTFAETGMQIRLNVYILEEFAAGTRETIKGFSYYNPLVNILDNFFPWVSIRLNEVSGYNFATQYTGLGFSQVAESYANFGLPGVIAFFSLMGYWISKIESYVLSPAKLALFSGIVFVFINASRNTFAFVPGQVLIMCALYAGQKFLLRPALFRTTKALSPGIKAQR